MKATVATAIPCVESKEVKRVASPFLQQRPELPQSTLHVTDPKFVVPYPPFCSLNWRNCNSMNKNLFAFYGANTTSGRILRWVVGSQ
jgi:hypothetical protein